MSPLTRHEWLPLNPTQAPVITADQAVFAIAKQVQWAYHERFNSFVSMLAPLCIEMAFMSVIDDWLEGLDRDIP